MRFADPGDQATPLHFLPAEAFDEWRARQPERVADWLVATGFRAELGRVALVPGGAGGVALAVAGLGRARTRART
ncbi:MAG: leucyl aminopeptidase family protein, partial [Alphaproteobacteria bacterium]